MNSQPKEYGVIARKDKTMIVLDTIETFQSEYEPDGWEDAGRIFLLDEERAAGEVILRIVPPENA